MGSPYAAEIDAFREFNIAKVIFESNLIEGAGRPLGETRKLILEYFPRFPSTFTEFYGTDERVDLPRLLLKNGPFAQINEELRSLGYDPARFTPSISMAGSSRSVKEVVQHHSAILYAMFHSIDYLIHRTMYDWAQSLKTDKLDKKLQKELEEAILKEYPHASTLEDIQSPKLFAEKTVSELHKTIAEGILPNDAKVEAGEYRIDNRIVGWDIVFPSPELISLMMPKFVDRANDIVQGIPVRKLNLFEAAARISHDFVTIHPFPDFNGRISRILMNMVLLAHNCPFPVALKGGSKAKGKYFTSLKRANNGNFIALSSLIAMRVTETFEELDTHLKRAGLRSLLTLSNRTQRSNIRKSNPRD